MSLARLAARLRALPDQMQRNLAAAELETQKEAHRLAVKLSSGTETTQSLARADHPYSQRAPNAAYNPAILNRKSRVFSDSWIMPTQVITGRTIRSSVINIDPKARFFEGTENMVPRLIGPEVLRLIEESRDRRIQRAIDKTLKGF